MHTIPTTKRTLAMLLACLLATTAALSSCGPIERGMDALDAAIQSIDTASTRLQRESTNWRNELLQLQTKLGSTLEQAQAQAATDVSRVVSDTMNQVGSLAEDTIKLSGLTAEELVARFGTEMRCNVDFTRARVTDSLHNFAERLKFWKANRKYPPPPTHSVCQVTPNKIQMTARDDSSWAVTFPPDKTVGVYGYDFRPDAVPSVELQDANGATVRESGVSVTYVTRYQINLNFATADLGALQNGFRYVLNWPDKPEPNTISAILITPAKLRIVGVEMDPPSPRARTTAVQPWVTVRNEGGSRSDPSTAVWSPGGDEHPPRSVGIPSLAPGEAARFTFQPYNYPKHGLFDSSVVVGNGSDSHRTSVTVTPYANVPARQSVPMRGQWPHGGGEPGQTMDFPPAGQMVDLGRDCVIDTSRGGGSFQVEDIDNADIKYTIAWPPGYDFNFGDNTFWRSLSAVSVRYDPAANQVWATVTLKGLGGHGLFAVRGPERFNGTFTAYTLCP